MGKPRHCFSKIVDSFLANTPFEKGIKGYKRSLGVMKT